jgi:hypothetical protein
MPTIRISRDADANIVGHDPMPRTPEGLIVEAWSQGYLVGSLIIMTFITLANMRRGVLLHKVRTFHAKTKPPLTKSSDDSHRGIAPSGSNRGLLGPSLT